MKRATIYLDDELHRALKIKSLESETSLSQIVNDAVRDSLAEDLADLSDIAARKGEKPISYEAFLKDLKSRGRL
jgi:predicted transcriptional regulator